MVGEGRQLGDRAVTADGDGDLDRLLGQVPDARGVDLEVLAPEVDQLSGVQLKDNLPSLPAS